ncbi:MAG: reverse transcriptase domain-containing protein, partial [Candidatus Omnitrophota bacterium]|nr:reverse transcriptase domain-containing protein [Candidatus Omnitrophota bacterium]
MNSGEPGYPQNGSIRQQVLKDKEPQKIFGQSDYPIVSMKQGNACGEKGIEGTGQDIRETSATLKGGEWMATKLNILTNRAKENPKLRFTSLIHLINEGSLLECLGELKSNKAPGIDGVRLEEYEVNKEANIKGLVERMKLWKYRPQPTRRTYIPKSNGDRRPLGIPTIEDKVVQMGIKKILEAIFEIDFLDVSYGFRPNRNCHQALDVLAKAVMTKPVNVVVDMDIE